MIHLSLVQVHLERETSSLLAGFEESSWLYPVQELFGAHWSCGTNRLLDSDTSKNGLIESNHASFQLCVYQLLPLRAMSP